MGAFVGVTPGRVPETKLGPVFRLNDVVGLATGLAVGFAMLVVLVGLDGRKGWTGLLGMTASIGQDSCTPLMGTGHLPFSLIGSALTVAKPVLAVQAKNKLRHTGEECKSLCDFGSRMEPVLIPFLCPSPA